MGNKCFGEEDEKIRLFTGHEGENYTITSNMTLDFGGSLYEELTSNKDFKINRETNRRGKIKIGISYLKRCTGRPQQTHGNHVGLINKKVVITLHTRIIKTLNEENKSEGK